MIISTIMIFWGLGGNLTGAIQFEFPGATRYTPQIFLIVAFIISLWRYYIDPRKNSFEFDRKVATRFEAWMMQRFSKEDFEENLMSIQFQELKREKPRLSVTSGISLHVPVEKFEIVDALGKKAFQADIGWRPMAIRFVFKEPYLPATFVDDKRKDTRFRPLRVIPLERFSTISKLARRKFTSIRIDEIRGGNEFFDVYGPYILATLASLVILGRLSLWLYVDGLIGS